MRNEEWRTNPFGISLIEMAVEMAVIELYSRQFESKEIRKDFIHHS